MGTLKNMTIKSTAKKRARQLINIIEEHPDTNPIDTLKTYVRTVESLGGQKIIEDGDYENLYQLFLFIVMIMVRDELSYDPTMGSKEDAELIKQAVDQEVTEWRNRIISMESQDQQHEYTKQQYSPWYAGIGGFIIVILLRNCGGV